MRQKLEMPTRRWTDILREQHDRAFVVAGATKMDLLADMKTAVEEAIEEGQTLDQFRESFDDITARHGWDFKGSRAWRSRVIYETNMRTAHAAGRFGQMTDPDVLDARPYWRYLHGGSLNPRERHLSWDGLVLEATDPWWRSHYPPSGWGCSCYTVSLSEADLDRLGLEVGEAPDDGTYEWTNPSTGEVEEVPVGIDGGWNYTPGESWVRSQTPNALDDWATSLGAGTGGAARSAGGGSRAGRSTSSGGAGSSAESGGSTGADRSSSTDDAPVPEGQVARGPDLPPPRTVPRSVLMDDGETEETYVSEFLAEFGATIEEEAYYEDAAGETIVVSDELFRTPGGSYKVKKRGRNRMIRLLARTLAEPDEIWARMEPLRRDPDQWVVARYYVSRWTVDGEERRAVSILQWTREGWYGVTTFDPSSERQLERRRAGIRLYRREALEEELIEEQEEEDT